MRNLGMGVNTVPFFGECCHFHRLPLCDPRHPSALRDPRIDQVYEIHGAGLLVSARGAMRTGTMPPLSEGTIMCLHSGEGSATALVRAPLREAALPL